MADKDPRDLKIEEFTYPLPEDRIALYPTARRDASLLLVSRPDGSCSKDQFSRLSHYLPEGSHLVLNDTRVIHARFLFRKPSGAAIEVFCLRPLAPEADPQLAFGCTSPVVWECLVGNAKRWKKETLSLQKTFEGQDVSLHVRKPDPGGSSGHHDPSFDQVTANPSGAQPISFHWEPAAWSFSQIMEAFGHIPLPPYIHRQDEELDKTRYQTVYARREGSVAAPTAGLHFTQDVFDSLKIKGISWSHLSLHVGAGTFRPVSSVYVGDHPMHPEAFYVSKQFLVQLIEKNEDPVYAVGTTTVRSLESLYWYGVQLKNGRIPPEGVPFYLDQWEPYDLDEPGFSRLEALEQVLKFMEERELSELTGHTRLIIAPPYRYRVVKGIITNFHQPASTLLLLVAAFAGDRWKKAYEFALENNFRFLSYGDSCLFLP